MNRNTRRKHKLREQLQEAREHIRILREGGPAAEALKAKYDLSEALEKSIIQRMWHSTYEPGEQHTLGLVRRMQDNAQ